VTVVIDSYIRETVLSDDDLDFVTETLSPGPVAGFEFKKIMKADEYLRNAFLGDEKVFARLKKEDEIFKRISPRLFFEVLLRRALSDLSDIEGAGDTPGRGVKKLSSEANNVVQFLNRERMVPYLADMLASFIGAGNQTISCKTVDGMWRKVTLSELDVIELMDLGRSVEEEFKFSFYKRIADICLFISGVRGYGPNERLSTDQDKTKAVTSGGRRPSSGECEKSGTLYYYLSAQHPAARELGLDGVLMALHENFRLARKPLRFITDQYLRHWRKRVLS
jgi:hypothetical protein